MDACTENYECLVLDNTSKSNKIEDCVFWYKAPIRKGFKIGSPRLWEFHGKNYNPRHATGNGKSMAKEMVKKRNAGPTLTVKKTG